MRMCKLLISIAAASTILCGQSKERAHRLVLVESIVAPSEVAGGYSNPLWCDENGNLYLHADRLDVWGVRKLSPKGELVAVYQPNNNPDFAVGAGGHFWVGPNGNVYQIVYPSREAARYVFIYKPDGSYKSKVKLDTNFVWFPSTLAVFASGNILIAGERHDPGTGGRLPFTAIFSSGGQLLNELVPKGEEAWDTKAVNYSQMEAAKDGNVYLMRWVSPAVVYAISAGGALVKQFTIDPASPTYRPAAMHVSGNRLAVLFFDPQTMEQIMKVVDLDGRELATYEKLKEKQLGAAFACYSLNPERFLFLGATNDHKIELRIAEVR